MTKTDDLIGTVEAADILGVNRATVTRFVERGVLVAVRPIPGLRAPLLFDRAHVEKLRDERNKGKAA